MSELSIVDALKIIFKKRHVIISITAAGAILAFLITQFFITPKYQASGTMYVSGKSDTNLTYTDVAQSQKLVESYAVVLQSRSAAKEILQATQLNYSVDEIQRMISIASINQSESMRISVVCENPGDAVLIANAAMDIAPDFLTDVVKVGTVSIIDKAESSHKIAPSMSKNILFGFALGLVISILLVLISSLLDRSVKDEDDILAHYNIAILGVVPNFNSSHKGGYYRYE